MTGPLGLKIPRLTANRVCCPRCHQRAPFLATGRTDVHFVGDTLCPDVFPAYFRAHRLAQS